MRYVMEDLREKQLQEVALRKKELMEKYDLTEKAFSLAKWKRDPYFSKLIENFEKKYNAIVYFIAPDSFVKSLSFLYVGQYMEEWENQRPSSYDDDMAYVCNLVYEDESEFGYVLLKKMNGKLIRVG